MTREIDKLVRDKIPGIIEDDGDDPVIHTADGDEYAARLAEKLDEEVAEYRETRDIEELVDILEVVHAIRKHRGLTVDELRTKRVRKGKKRGRFDDRIVLERIEK